MNIEGDIPSASDDEPQAKKMTLTVKVDATSACQRHVTVTISREDIDRYFQEKFDEIAPKAEVPGFRVGRAPRQLLENRFRKQIGDQVKGSLLMDSLSQVSDEQDFSAISEPDFDFDSIKIPDEGPMTYEFNIEVRPEFEMPAWKGLKLERPEHQFSDKEIDAELEQILARFADLVPVDEPAIQGDYVVVNITGRHAGREISRLNEETIELRPKLSFADAILEGFDQLMIGARSGEARSASVTVSEYAGSEELQGKEMELEFELLDVKRLDLSERDKMAANAGMESIDQLREFVAKGLESQLEYEQRQRIRQQISQLLTESANWDLPRELLRRQSRRELERAVIEMRSSGFSDAQIQAQENRLRHNASQRTATMLKEHFILERIAEDEGIEDLPEDYETEIQRIAAQRNDSPRRIRARLERTGQMDALRNMIIERKVLDLITEHAQFKATKYKPTKTHDTVAIEFFVAGRDPEEIPEAKYDEPQSQPIPSVIERD